MPASPNQPYDMKKVIAAVVDNGDYFEVHRHWAMSITCGFARMDGRVVGIVGTSRPSWPASSTSTRRRRPRASSGSATRSTSPPHLRRRPRLHAGDRSGVRGHHPPRGQAPLRLLRVDRAPDPDHHPQGLRRRLRRHELQVDRRRPGLRLAVGGTGGHGPQRRRRDRLPPRTGRGAGPGQPAGRAHRRVHRALRQSLHRGGTGLHRRRHLAGRHPGHHLPEPGDPLLQARGAPPPQARQRARCESPPTPRRPTAGPWRSARGPSPAPRSWRRSRRRRSWYGPGRPPRRAESGA